MLESVNQWIIGTALHHWVLDSPWAWPTFEILHFFGLCLLLGALLIVDLRVLGFLRATALGSVHRLMPAAMIGLAINALTGAAFYVGDPGRYSINIAFQIKMLLVLIAGANALWFMRTYGPLLADGSWLEPNGAAKVSAGLSLILWAIVLACGRLIPYVGTG